MVKFMPQRAYHGMNHFFLIFLSLLICHFNLPYFNYTRYIKMSRKFSGLQKEVLTLYRQCLRSVYEKPEVCSTNETKGRNMIIY